MTFLSKGVCVPEEHVHRGIAPVTPGPDGQALRLDAGHRRATSSCTPRSTGPEMRRWPSSTGDTGSTSLRDDVNSRAALAILEILFALQESDGKNVGPLLTLPLGGG